MSTEEELSALRDRLVKNPSPLFMPRSRTKFHFITVKKYDFDSQYTLMVRVCDAMKDHGLHPDRVNDFREAMRKNAMADTEVEKWVHLEYMA